MWSAFAIFLGPFSQGYIITRFYNKTLSSYKIHLGFGMCNKYWATSQHHLVACGPDLGCQLHVSSLFLKFQHVLLVDLFGMAPVPWYSDIWDKHLVGCNHPYHSFLSFSKWFSDTQLLLGTSRNPLLNLRLPPRPSLLNSINALLNLKISEKNIHVS